MTITDSLQALQTTFELLQTWKIQLVEC